MFHILTIIKLLGPHPVLMYFTYSRQKEVMALYKPLFKGKSNIKKLDDFSP